MMIEIFQKSIMSIKYLLLIVPLTLSAQTLDPIVVATTANMQEQTHQAVGNRESIEAPLLDLYQIDSVGDIGTLMPNVNISGIGGRSNQTFTIRGVSNYVAYESSVAIYVDGVPLPFSYGYGLIDTNNLTSVVLSKGGGASLFGKGSESGRLEFTTHHPSKETKGELSLELGSYNHQSLHGFVSGETAYESLFYSLAFNHERFDGYSHNALTGNRVDHQDLNAFHAKLRYEPSDDLSLSFVYSKNRSDDGGSAFTVNSKEQIRTVTDEPMDEFVTLRSDRLGVEARYRWGDYLLESSTSYVKQVMDKGDYIAVVGGVSLLRDSRIEEITQDLQLKRSFESSDVRLGLFYSKKLAFYYAEDQVLLNLYPTPMTSSNQIEDPDEVMALSAKYDYYFNDQFSLSAGFRYQESRRDFDRSMNRFGAPTTHVNASNRWRKFLPLLSLSYFLKEESHLTFSYSQGFRIGGYNYRSSDTLTPYNEETTTSYELGYKQIFGGGLRLHALLFYNDIEDMRVVSFDDTFGTSLSNADAAHSYGVEVDMHYEWENLFFYGSFGITRAKYDRLYFQEQDYSDYDVIDTPQMSASFGLSYHLNSHLYTRASVGYMGKRYYNLQNSAFAKGYTVSNLSLGYEEGDWEVELYGKNIFDRDYVDFMIATPSNNYTHFGAPRTVGVKLSKNF
jgi:iron complex outermembrane receptor protein